MMIMNRVKGARPLSGLYHQSLFGTTRQKNEVAVILFDLRPSSNEASLFVNEPAQRRRKYGGVCEGAALYVTYMCESPHGRAGERKVCGQTCGRSTAGQARAPHIEEGMTKATRAPTIPRIAEVRTIN